MIDRFQFTANELLVRHKSILDIITKIQDSNARLSRGIIKAVTQCGCISIDADKQKLSPDLDFDEIKTTVSSHIEGKLCDNCKDLIERDIGRNLFYLASMCNTLDLNLYDIIIKEYEKITMLGKYNLR